jgi:hypothetical protein
MRDISPKLRKDYKLFRSRGFSHVDSTRLARQEASMVGHIGDVNWLDYGGGPVYRHEGYHVLEYIIPPEEDARRKVWEVYMVHLGNPGDAKDWLKRGSVQQSTGISTKEYLAALRSKNPLAEANVWQDIAGHYGWHELDQYPLHLSKKEITLRYGEEPSE